MTGKAGSLYRELHGGPHSDKEDFPKVQEVDSSADVHEEVSGMNITGLRILMHVPRREHATKGLGKTFLEQNGLAKTCPCNACLYISAGRTEREVMTRTNIMQACRKIQHEKVPYTLHFD